MRIIVNSEKENQLINSFCDLALKAGGVQNLNEVNMIQASIEKAYTPKKPVPKKIERKALSQSRKKKNPKT